MHNVKNFSVLLLAAGKSCRFGLKNKLLYTWQGKPLVLHAVDNILEAGIKPIVVLGYEAKEIKAALEKRPVEYVENLQPHKGMGTSIATGINVLAQNTQGVFICPADMPCLSPEIFSALLKIYNPQENHHICYPVYKGRQGHPVLFGQYFFDNLAQLNMDAGAREIIATHPLQACRFTTLDENIFLDIDTLGDIINLP